MKPIYLVLAILAPVTIVTIVTMSTQQVYAPRSCAGCSEFKKLTHEFEKDVLDALPPGVPGNDVNEFKQLLTQFKKDVINAVINDHLSLIPGIVEQFVSALGQPLPTLPPETQQDIDEYTQEVLRIFCRPCV